MPVKPPFYRHLVETFECEGIEDLNKKLKERGLDSRHVINVIVLDDKCQDYQVFVQKKYMY